VVALYVKTEALPGVSIPDFIVRLINAVDGQLLRSVVPIYHGSIDFNIVTSESFAIELVMPHVHIAYHIMEDDTLRTLLVSFEWNNPNGIFFRQFIGYRASFLRATRIDFDKQRD